MATCGRLTAWSFLSMGPNRMSAQSHVLGRRRLLQRLVGLYLSYLPFITNTEPKTHQKFGNVSVFQHQCDLIYSPSHQ